jgi:hypothetical protein
MATVTGVARASFVYDKKFFKFGSIEESFAISEFVRRRDLTFHGAVMASSSDESREEIMKRWVKTVFVERKIDGIKKLRDYSEDFNKYKNLKIKVLR